MTATSGPSSGRPVVTAVERATHAKVLAHYRRERKYLGPYEAMRAVRDRARNSYMLGVKYELPADEAGQLADFAQWDAAGVYLESIHERDVTRLQVCHECALAVVAP